MKVTFEMEYDQVDAIIVGQLKEAHKGAMVDLDFELAKAIELVLRHWMLWDEYNTWFKEVCGAKEDLY